VDYTTKLFLPILKQNIRYKNITNKNYFDIIRFITNNDDEGLNEYFEWLLYDIIIDKDIIKKLTNVEKFLILLDNRSNTIGNSLQIKNDKNNKIELSIITIKNDIIKNLNKLNLTKVVNSETYTVEFSLPKSLIINSIDDIYKQIFNKIRIEEDEIQFSLLTDQEKLDIINIIPAEISAEMMSFIKNTKEGLTKIKIITENTKIGLENIDLNSYDSTLFMFLKSIFKDSLMNFYELQYSLVTKMNVGYDQFVEMTPNECKLYIKFYNDEKRREQEEQEKQQGSIPSMPSIPKFK
jgi:hypothetical protein